MRLLMRRRTRLNYIYIFEFQISMQSVYAAFEGTAMRQCREYNSDFSWVVFYSSIGSVIGPFLASVTIEDAVDGSGGKVLLVLVQNLH